MRTIKMINEEVFILVNHYTGCSIVELCKPV